MIFTVDERHQGVHLYCSATRLVRVFLEPRLQHPDLGFDLDRLVGTHYWIGLFLPTLLQRTAAGFFRLEKFEIFALLVMVGLNFVGEYVYVVNFQVFEDVGGKIVDLHGEQ